MRKPLDIATRTQESISDELDKALLEGTRAILDELKDGVKLRDIKGAAALLNVARQRMRDLGISKVVTPGDAAALLAQEIGVSLEDVPESEKLEEEVDAGYSRIKEIGRVSPPTGG